MLERGVRRFPHLTTIDKLDRALGFSTEERSAFRRLASRAAATSTVSTPVIPSGPDWVVAQPAARAGFTGRGRQLEPLIELLTKPAPRLGSPTVATIRGMAGVGKTSLAIEAAHATSAHYPDGILSVNLRGFGSGTPLSPLQAIGQLLRATGVPPEGLPDGPEEAAAALRTRLTGRRVLLLLDNAGDVHQVPDLIPAAEGSAVIITSRNTLTTLPADLHLQLDPLPPDESAGLLSTIAGVDRLGDATARIAALCGHLPLALSVAAAWLLSHPATSGAELAHRLEDETHRLDLLGVDDLDVRASLSLSVDQLVRSPDDLDHNAARALSLLSLSDAEDFTPDTAAALIDATPAAADRLLERLTDLHLFESRMPGRYQFHDLVRAFGRELAGQLPQADRDAALDRSLTQYLAVAWREAELSDPHAARSAWPGRPRPPAFPLLTNSDQALGWIDEEWQNYLALIEQVRTLGGRDEQVAGLVVGLYNYFARRGNLADWLPAIDGVSTGRIDRWTLAQLHADAAIALAELARYDESAERFGLAREAFESIGNLRGVSLAANNKARLLIRMHRYAEALPLAEQAQAVNEKLGNQRALGAAHLTLTEVHTELGNWREAEQHGSVGIAHFEAAADADGVVNARIDRAWVRVKAGRPDAAVADILTSIGELEQLGHRKNLSDAHYVLGLTRRRLHEPEPAIEQTELALEIALEVGDRRREARSRLALGELLTEIGEPEDAVPNLEFALEFYAEHDPVMAQQAEEALRAARADPTV